MTKSELHFEYKDHLRTYWYIDVLPGQIRFNAIDGPDCSDGFVTWIYFIYRERRLVHSGEFEMQSQLTPDVRDVWQEYLSSLIKTGLDFAVSPEQSYGRLRN